MVSPVLPATMATRPPTSAAIRHALADVHDPEIPTLSIVDLGIVHDVRVDGAGIRVELLPTFVGCPALDLIRDSVRERLASFGRPVEVAFTFAVPWTSDRITPQGRASLRRGGFAPPSASDGPQLVSLEAPVACPFCGSTRTIQENAFGSAQCRSIRYCTACRQPFEQIKTI
jgi:ring-1,2-phenylacetyl-CoA epoxidase subunit PaaD